jgi:hypothetical protein
MMNKQEHLWIALAALLAEAMAERANEPPIIFIDNTYRGPFPGIDDLALSLLEYRRNNPMLPYLELGYVDRHHSLAETARSLNEEIFVLKTREAMEETDNIRQLLYELHHQTVIPLPIVKHFPRIPQPPAAVAKYQRFYRSRPRSNL